MNKLRIFLWLGLVSLLIAACSNGPTPGEGQVPPPDVVVPEFIIAVSPDPVSVVQEGSAEVVTVTVEREGFTGTIDLDLEDLPSGVTAFISDPGTSSEGFITFQASGSAPVDDHQVSVIATSPDAEEAVETEFILRVLPSDGETGDTAITGVVQTANARIGISSSRASSDIESLGVVGPAAFDSPFVPGQVLVQYAEPQGEIATQAMLEQRQEVMVDLQGTYGLTVLDAGLPGEPALLGLPEHLSVPEAVAQLQADPRVKYAEPNYYLYTTAIPNDPHLDRQWALASAGVPVAWEVETGTSNRVVVAVIDSGFDLNHEDLQGRYVQGRDFCPVASGNCPGQDDTRSDSDPSFGNSANFHGTHVAGIVAAIGNNSRGVAGVAYGNNIRILPVKIFNDQGGGATSHTFVRGIRWAVGLNVSGAPTNPNPARIINLSVGGFFDSSIVQNAVNEARNRGTILFAAAGNNGINSIMAPASAQGVVAVGSINQSFRRSCFSNYGTGLDIVAPGGDGPALSSPSQPAPAPNCSPPAQALYSTTPQNNYSGAAGTSMATPMVSGVAALLWSQNPNLSRDEVENRLLNTAYFDNTYMSASEYGNGVLRADLALGLPGPGDTVSITAQGTTNNISRIATVTLDLYGSSSSFRLSNLTSGTYVLEAEASGTRRSLSGQEQVNAQPGQTSNVVIDLTP